MPLGTWALHAERTVIWGGAGIKRRGEEEIEAIEVNGEVPVSCNAGAWGQQEVGYVAEELRGLISGERFEMIQKDKSEKEAQKDMVERGLLAQRCAMSSLSTCIDIQTVTLLEVDAYATRTAIAKAIFGKTGGRNTGSQNFFCVATHG